MRLEFNTPEHFWTYVKCVLCYLPFIAWGHLVGDEEAQRAIMFPILFVGGVLLVMAINLITILASVTWVSIAAWVAHAFGREGPSYAGAHRSERRSVGYTDPFR